MGNVIGTYIQRKVEAQDITFAEQGVKVDVLRVALHRRIQLCAVVITDAHAEHFGLGRYVPTDAAHAEDAQYFPLGVMA